jgi:hypothetical protein
MSVTGIGALVGQPSQHPWDWQTNGPNGQNSTGGTATSYTTNSGTTGGAPGDGATNAANGNAAGTGTINTKSAPNGTTDRNQNQQSPPLPPVQAATAPGTGQKVDVIA